MLFKYYFVMQGGKLSQLAAEARIVATAADTLHREWLKRLPRPKAVAVGTVVSIFDPDMALGFGTLLPALPSDPLGLPVVPRASRKAVSAPSPAPPPPAAPPAVKSNVKVKKTHAPPPLREEGEALVHIVRTSKSSCKVCLTLPTLDLSVDPVSILM